MSSLFRRAGAKIARLVRRPADPAAAPRSVQLYTKDLGGQTGLFAIDDLGIVYPITPPPTFTGGIQPWNPLATYQGGETVDRGPWVWRADNITTQDPCFDDGSPITWALTGTAAPSVGDVVLVNGTTGSTGTAYAPTAIADWGSKMMVVEIQISGIADGIGFGIFDSSLPVTATNINGLVGFYGIVVDIFNSLIRYYADGVSTATVGYSNLLSVNCGDRFDRWFLRMNDLGVNWSLELLRYTVRAGAATAFPSYEDLARVWFTTQVKPAFDSFRMIAGAFTGGAAGIFSIRRGYMIPYVAGNWSQMSTIPTQLTI